MFWAAMKDILEHLVGASNKRCKYSLHAHNPVNNNSHDFLVLKVKYLKLNFKKKKKIRNIKTWMIKCWSMGKHGSIPSNHMHSGNSSWILSSMWVKLWNIGSIVKDRNDCMGYTIHNIRNAYSPKHSIKSSPKKMHTPQFHIFSRFQLLS